MRLIAFLFAISLLAADHPDANRLTYLDEKSPYHPTLQSARLTTPQWVGEAGVEAIAVLAIDDMKGPAGYETYLRPILERLKAIDGRAPLSIMTNQVVATDPQLQTWLAEGVSLESHTLTHPCPLLQKFDFASALKNYNDCLDALWQIPNNQSVAFRMPCCDSMNSPSPRFFSEIFNKATAKGHFLSIDSSVFQRFTPKDPALNRSIVFGEDGLDRFQRYLPFKSFVNIIEDYPYPYVIDRLCWEFPCVVPSDWEAQNVLKPFHSQTVIDMEAALEATVAKQGVFNLVFHPHGWIKNTQIVELIDHANTLHKSRLKFLSFREANERINQNLLDGQPLRDDAGADNGVRLLDLDHDGYQDLVVGNPKVQFSKVWNPEEKTWIKTGFPRSIANLETHFGFVTDPIHPAMLVSEEGEVKAFQFTGTSWRPAPELVKLPDQPPSFDRGFRLRDLDRVGVCELLIASPGGSAVYQWNGSRSEWTELSFRFPVDAKFAYINGDDGGLRLIDVNEDGFVDLVYSNDEGFGLYLFESWDKGWSIEVRHGQAGEPAAIPKFVSEGKDRGGFVQKKTIWWQNEETAKLPDVVDRRSFQDLLGFKPSVIK